ncbi:hypothetical protein LP414_27580 [Polaromonas sp. P1(28)-13]|nr:hypothetical protein LP414_27580 [Polaromonas sp. P1(28)-13]
MHWIITVDHINKGEEANYVNRMRSPKEFAAALRAATPEAKSALRSELIAGMTDEFRLFDDDGELYYEGLCKDLDDQDEDNAFQPLDWARNDAGCTRMDHRKIGKVGWATL